ncbi:branched-chain amino acid ABC transporter permease [Ancylobacter terrae]|uniref:branched-chain amino acid ABC transporter permease n=1 Tax=Ancylobacter sp. sgz301288 TaxID=3342077 RepID=UPI00385E9767
MRILLSRNALPLLLVLVAGLLLAACGSVIDGDQARVCRAVAPALEAEGAGIREVALRPVPGETRALRLDYVVRLGEAARPRWLICRFAGTGGTERWTLAGVDTDRGPLSGIRLAILKRWWLAHLDEIEGQVPLPPPRFTVSPGLAYGVQQALNGLTLAGVYGLVATSFALLYGLIGRINLAFGEIAVAGGAYALAVIGLVAEVGRLGGSGVLLAILSAIAGGAVLSWAIGRAVVLPVDARARSGQPVLVATLALAIVIGEFLRLTAPGRESWMPPLLNAPIPLAGGAGFTATTTPAQMLAAGLGLSAASALLAVIDFTAFGRAWRAYADDPRMAALLGVPVPRLLAGSFLLAGAAAGLAGAMVVVAYGTITPGDGLAIGLKALVAAIIGGIGSVRGAFIGAVIVAAVETGWSMSFDIAYRDVVIYTLLVLALVLRPGGLPGGAGAPSPREF